MSPKLVRIMTHHENPKRAAELFIEESVVAIGFDIGIDRPFTGMSRDEIKNVFMEEWGASDQQAAIWTATVVNFIHEVKIGDIVLAYMGGNIVAAVGEVIGDYEYNDKNKVGDPNGEIQYPNQRKVRWWSSPRYFHRSKLPTDLYKWVALPATLYTREYDMAQFKAILQGIPSEGIAMEVQPTVGLEEARAFALETHLRDFLARNLQLIEEGLSLFRDETGREGIEYPTDTGPIDLLAVNRNGDFVVFELKVSRGPDRALGQLMRYMGWVRKKLAGTKDVRGIIVAQRMDDGLKLAASENPRIRLLEYELSFKVRPAEPYSG